jgi:Protein of unknown function (DUF3179)
MRVSLSTRVSRPRVIIGLLVLFCALIAVISVMRTSGSDSSDPSIPTASAPPFDVSKLTTIHPKDGIPSLTDPRLEEVSSVDWLAADEPVIAVEVGDVQRAYPLRILTWHEIVNDEINGTAISVTYCPLCSSAVAFVRPRIQGTPASFGTSGRLYRSNLVMYDRATDSLWPQLMGLAVRGEMAGSELLRLPVSVVSWGDFLAAYPKAQVMSEVTGFDRPYGENPYPRFDTGADPPPEIDVDVDGRLPAVDRVLGIRAGGEVAAYSFTRLRRDAGEGGLTVVNDSLGGQRIVVIWKGGTRSALDKKKMARSRDVGSAVAYAAQLGARTLRFGVRDGKIVDGATGSTWDIFGNATAGPLRGGELPKIDVIEAFWFQWAAFHPKTTVWASTGR